MAIAIEPQFLFWIAQAHQQNVCAGTVDCLQYLSVICRKVY